MELNCYAILLIMLKIAIRNESLSKRCEVCHQIDCYDPQTNRCSRCDEIKEHQVSQFKFQDIVKRRAIAGSNYYWYRRAADLYLLFAGIPSIIIIWFHISSFLPLSCFMLFMLCVGFVLLFLGLSVIVHGSTQGINIWKVIGGALLCAITLAV